MKTSGRWELATALRHSLSDGLEPWAEAGFAEGSEFHSLKKVVGLAGFISIALRSRDGNDTAASTLTRSDGRNNPATRVNTPFSPPLQ